MDTIKNKPYKLATVIGRFQLKHVGHGLLLNKAAAIADHVLILIGSSFQPRTIKNPFTYAERSHMIAAHMQPLVGNSYGTCGLYDNIYSDDSWVKQVQSAISACQSKLGAKDNEVCIVGHDKDESTYYLKLFPQYKLEIVDEIKLELDATSIRNILFAKPEDLKILGSIVPAYVRGFLEHFMKTPEYERLVREHKYYEDYKVKYGAGPFVTVDALIKKKGHIYLIQRGDDPGMDLWAMPGGFMELDETIRQALLREVDEETNIDIPPGLLDGSITKVHTFDHPKRSLRARIITHTHLIDLDRDKKPGFPNTKAGSDAKDGKWFTIDEVMGMSEVMYEDHLSQIKFMLGMN